MTISALFYVVAAASAAVGLWRLKRTQKTGRGHGLPVLCLGLAAALVFLADPSQRIESTIWPSLGRLLANLATIIAAYGAVLLFAEINNTNTEVIRRGPRRTALIFAAVLLIAAFFATPTLHHGIGTFANLYESEPTLVAYSVVYALYLGVAVADIGVMCLRTLRPSRRLLRAGLTLVLAACALAEAYIIDKLISILHGLFTTELTPGPCPGPFAGVGCTFSVGFPALSILLLVTGITLIGLAPRLLAARDRRSTAVMRPFASELGRRHPEVVTEVNGLDGSPREELIAVMKQCRDGLLMAGVSDTSRPQAAARELHRRRAEDSEPGSVVTEAVAGDFETERRQLCQLARTYCRLAKRGKL